MFQSLSRDSGRLNAADDQDAVLQRDVSIPQSGFGAFERPAGFVPGGSGPRVSIPQSGFGAFERETTATTSSGGTLFQSLSRDSGHLNAKIDFIHEFPELSFNPSVGIRGI